MEVLDAQDLPRGRALMMMMIYVYRVFRKKPNPYKIDTALSIFEQ